MSHKKNQLAVIPSGEVFLTKNAPGFGASIVEAAEQQNQKRLMVGVVSQVEFFKAQITQHKTLIRNSEFAIRWHERQVAAIEADAFSLSISGKIVFDDKTLNYNNPDDAMHERGQFGSLE